jgi:hypothetical protein
MSRPIKATKKDPNLCASKAVAETQTRISILNGGGQKTTVEQKGDRSIHPAVAIFHRVGD